MNWPGFVGPSYRLETPNAANDRAINCYTEVIERGPRAGSLRLRGIGGLSNFATLPTTPVRALFANTDQGRLFAVGGGVFYEVLSDGTLITYGPIANGTNPAIIVSNGNQLAIASAGVAYIVPGGAPAAPTPIIDTEGDPVNAATMAFQDQYFIAGVPNTKQFRISKLAPNGGTWDPADEGFKEAYADNIQRVWVDQPGGTFLWLFGTDTTEIFADTGALFPFQRVNSQVFPIGCDSAWSVAGAGGSRFWLWKNQVWGAIGFQPQRISDYAVEGAIKKLSFFDKANAEGFSYIDRGHVFYVISFPQSGVCFGYDQANKMWHERQYFSNGLYSRYRPRVTANIWGMDLVGDYQTGRIYQMSETTYVDADTGAGAVPLRRQRTAPYLTEEMKNTRFDRLTLDMDTGIGLSVASDQPGYDPQILLRYSNDRGKNWSNELSQSLGKIGESDKRVFWTQLGSSRIGFVADVVLTDPVPFSINGSDVETSPGTMVRRAA